MFYYTRGSFLLYLQPNQSHLVGVRAGIKYMCGMYKVEENAYRVLVPNLKEKDNLED
jgi:hypothetical protein